jgi:predicted amidophosphoribosyltransferase
MHPWLAELVALAAPPACLACGRTLATAGERLCTPCVRGLPWLAHPCPRCALPRHRGGRCPAARAAFASAWAPVAYDGVARRLVLALKFRQALAAAEVMAAQMAANLPVRLRGLDAVLVPVPALPRRRRARGFDPAGLLAATLAGRLGHPLEDCLARADRTGRQVGAGRRERRAPDRLRLTLRGQPPRVAVLVDDVHTTGATLDACARALAAGGTTVAAALTYARTL